MNLTCQLNSIMLLKDAKEVHSRTLSGKIELESPENKMTDIVSDEDAASFIQAYKKARKATFPQQTPEGIPITAENKDEKGIAEMLREYWKTVSPEYDSENDKKFHSSFRVGIELTPMTENEYLFQQFLLDKLGMSEDERKLYTFEGQMEVLMEDINTVGGIFFLACSAQMAANDISNFKNNMPKISLPKFPKFPTGGGSWQLVPAGAGAGSISVAAQGVAEGVAVGAAEGAIGLGNGGFSGFPDMGSLGLGLQMMEGINNSNNIINSPEAKILVTGDEWEEYFKIIYGEENVIRNIPKGSSDNLKEVNIHGTINSEIDELDLINKIIYEDKNASKLYMDNPDVPQTERQWAEKQIFKKGKNRIESLKQPNFTISSEGWQRLPEPEVLREVKNYVFRIDADNPALRSAVQNELDKLKSLYPEYNFSAIFGGE